jgi:hypothetical protein
MGQCSLPVVVRLLRCRSRLQTRQRRRVRRVRCSFDECLTSSIFFRATIAEELAELGIGDLVIFVRDIDTDLRDAHSFDHLARLAMVPMLIAVFFLRRRLDPTQR